MAENQTIREAAYKQRWCMEEVPRGQEKWDQGTNAWHPFPGRCKGYGREKVNGEWRCRQHLPKAQQPRGGK